MALEINTIRAGYYSGNPRIIQTVGPNYTTIIAKTQTGTGSAANADTYDTVNVSSGSAGRAFVAQSYTFLAGVPYILMARFSNVVNSNPASSNSVGLTFISTSNITYGGGSPKVTSDGLWCVAIQYSVDTATTFRVGVGMSMNAANCSATISDVSLYRLNSFPTVGSPIPPTRGAWDGLYKHQSYSSTWGNTYSALGLVTEAAQGAGLSGTPDQYRVGVFVSDSFGNDNQDWPAPLAQNYGMVLYGGAWPGQPMSYFDTKADDVFSRSGLTDVGDALPTFAICQSSINSADAGQTSAQMIATMTSIINKARSHGLKPFVTNMTPFGTSMSAGEKTEMQAYNAALPALCASLQAVLIDVNTVVTDPANSSNLLPAYDNGDGIHLNATGAAAYAAEINRAIVYSRQWALFNRRPSLIPSLIGSVVSTG